LRSELLAPIRICWPTDDQASGDCPAHQTHQTHHDANRGTTGTAYG
jgi:hypothetical protein